MPGSTPVGAPFGGDARGTLGDLAPQGSDVSVAPRCQADATEVRDVRARAEEEADSVLEGQRRSSAELQELTERSHFHDPRCPKNSSRRLSVKPTFP